MLNSVNPQLNKSTKIEVGFEELVIVLIANQLNPTILQLDFLKMSGIIPTDWELQQQPIQTPNVAQLVFQNEVNIVAQPRSITFTEIIDAKNGQLLKMPELVRQFIQRLPNADYQGVHINPKTLVAFPVGNDPARKFIAEKLLSPGPWSNYGITPVQAALSFFYQLERCRLQVNVNESRIQQSDKPPIPALLFSGSFNYEVTNSAASERQHQLILALQNWLTDLESFREIVNKRFLGKEDSVFLAE